MYGGKKSLGWSVDHNKLLKYLNDKYDVQEAHYYAGIDICDYAYKPLVEYEISVNKIYQYLEAYIENPEKSDYEIKNAEKSIEQVKFYRKLNQVETHFVFPATLQQLL